MTASQNQDFVTYIGDSVSPIFTVLGADGVTAIDISGVTEISWFAQRNANDVVALVKHKSTAGITFVTNGTDGKFQVAIAGTDTNALSGWYLHFATITTSNGVVTVEAGRMMVGQSPNWSYDDGTSASEDIYLVRDMIGDTIQSDQLLSDQTIFNTLKRYSVAELAAAECCRFIAARFARQVDSAAGSIRNSYSQRVRSYKLLEGELLQLGYARGGATAYTGGTSITDKVNVAENTDRVPPNFVIAMFDNLLPESPVGRQTNANLGETLDVGIQDGFLG